MRKKSHDGAAMSVHDVAAYLGLSVATVWRLVKDDETFPKRFRLGKLYVCWDRAEVTEWYNQQKSKKVI